MVPDKHIVSFYIVFLIIFCLGIVVSYLSFDFLKRLKRDNIAPQKWMRYTCIIATILYFIAVWTVIFTYTFMNQSLISTSNHRNKLISDCNIDVESIYNGGRVISVTLFGFFYYATAFVIYLRLIICFDESAYAISACVKRFNYTMFGLIGISVFGSVISLLFGSLGGYSLFSLMYLVCYLIDILYLTWLFISKLSKISKNAVHSGGSNLNDKQQRGFLNKIVQYTVLIITCTLSTILLSAVNVTTVSLGYPDIGAQILYIWSCCEILINYMCIIFQFHGYYKEYKKVFVFCDKRLKRMYKLNFQQSTVQQQSKLMVQSNTFSSPNLSAMTSAPTATVSPGSSGSPMVHGLLPMKSISSVTASPDPSSMGSGNDHDLREQTFTSNIVNSDNDNDNKQAIVPV